MRQRRNTYLKNKTSNEIINTITKENKTNKMNKKNKKNNEKIKNKRWQIGERRRKKEREAGFWKVFCDPEISRKKWTSSGDWTWIN